MSISVATPRYVFGASVACFPGSILFVDNQTIVYPAGSCIVVYNLDQHSQRLIPGSERSRAITAMALTPNRRYLAVAERAAGEADNERAMVTVYDIQALRKRKILMSVEVRSQDYISLAFSPDSKHLVTLGGAPDWTMLYWLWEKSKVLALVRTGNPLSTAPLEQVSFSPGEHSHLCVIGDGMFKLFRFSEGILKQFAIQKADFPYLKCHAWLSEEVLVAGTADGRLIVYESGEPRREFTVLDESFRQRSSSAIFIPDQSADSFQQSTKSGDSVAAIPACAITAIVTYAKGFACACGQGLVHLFEKTDDRSYFHPLRLVVIPQDPNSYEPDKSWLQYITSLAVSPAEEHLVCSTAFSQLFSFSLSNTESVKAHFDVLGLPFHSAHITGLDVCLRKPIIATCSTDKSVRIWNFETCNLELYREFAEDAYSISLHPTGLYALIGFSDKLRLMNLLIDDIRMFHEFSIRSCRESCFSNGGHMFAATHGNVIQIYSTTTFENVTNLKGHNNRVRSIAWSHNDLHLVTCGADGAVYEWDISSSKRLGENVLKTCVYNGVTISKDGRSIFAVGNDCTLKEFGDSQVLRSVESPGTILTAVGLSHAGRMLFVGTAAGAVRSLKFPLTVPGEWAEFQAHSAPITRMRITYDDQFLVTVSEDACIVLWRIQDKEGRGKKSDREVSYAEEILITKSDLEEKNTALNELKTRVDELKMENEYQLRLRDLSYNEKLKELTEKFVQDMEVLKAKLVNMKGEMDQAEIRHADELRDVIEKHMKEIEETELLNSQKLMLEYEKFNELQTKSQRMQEDYESQLREVEKTKEQGLEELTDFYEAKLQEACSKLEQCQEEFKVYVRENEEIKRQIEEDTDREVTNLKTNYELRLREDRDLVQKMKSEGGILRKKFTSLQKEMEEQKESVRKQQADSVRLNTIIRNMEKDIVALKKEIQERDDTIQDKEKRIYDLKKKNQELEKFKFVLDYKIKELKKQIEPREKDIKQMKEQIQEMEGELGRFQKQNNILELKVEDERQKLKATEREMLIERTKARDLGSHLNRFQNDIYRCVGQIQDPKLLKDNIQAIYVAHVQDDFNPETASVDANIQKEHGHQREHLEKTISSLISRLSSDNEHHHEDNVRIMQENVALMAELNQLRQVLKETRERLRDLEGAMGLHRSDQKLSPTELLTMIASSTKNAQLEREVTERRRLAGLQSHELLKLRNELCVKEKNMGATSTCTGGLGVVSSYPTAFGYFKPASANDAGFFPATVEEPGFFPPIDQ